MVQGISVGGEYGASATYLSEMAHGERRGMWSSLQYVTLIAGQLTALLVLVVLQSVMSKRDLEEWGWRIPFVIGGLLAVAVFRLRRGLLETESYARAARNRSGALLLLREHPRAVATVVGLTAGGTLAFYAFTTYMQKYLVVTAGFSAVSATRISAIALFLFMVLQPAVGALSDRIGRRPVLIAFGVLGSTLTVPLFRAIGGARTEPMAVLFVLAALVIVSGYTAINAVVKAELFPSEIRTLGVALPYAIANTIFGGTAEYVALWFKSKNLEEGFFYYVAGMVLVSLVIYVRMKETRRINVS